MVTAFALFCSLGVPAKTMFEPTQQKDVGFEYRVHEEDKITAEEFKSRRALLRKGLKSGAAVLLVTNPLHQRSNDTDFPFRPNSYFWYVSGCEEEDSAILILKDPIKIGDETTDEVLFVREKNAGAETWTGITMGPAKAKELLKVTTVVSNKRFKEVLDAVKPSQFALVERPDGLTGEVKRFVDTATESFKDVPKDASAKKILDEARSIKSPAEIELTWKSIKATCKAHIEALKSCEYGQREYEIKSLVEYIFGKHGCESVAYGSIVGSGVNSCVLHYVDARKKFAPNDMVCMDVGGEYHGYASDVTRSYPVSGKYSQAQREIYEIVRQAQEAGVQACKVGAPFNAADTAARKIVADGLLKLGIIQSANQSRQYFMHGTSHYVGLDVHDTGNYGPLQASQIITVEPGIYIKEGSPCDPKYWNIGVRIEDTILITTKGVVNMSGSLLPRSVTEIEAIMAQKSIFTRLNIEVDHR
jgi:Xaa-Pro aminopeptidase